MRRLAPASTTLLAILLLGAAFSAAQETPADRFDETIRNESGQAADGRAVDEPGDFEPGYLGIIADDRDEARGVRVLDVVPGGPASGAGLLPGDLILGITNRPVPDMETLSALIQTQGPGSDVIFQIERRGQPLEVRVRLGRRPPPGGRAFADFGRIPDDDRADQIPDPRAPTEPPPGAPPEAQRQVMLGVRAVPATAEAARHLRLPTTRGALVVEVRPNTPAAEAGIPVDAFITAINGFAVENPADLVAMLNRVEYGDEVEITFYWRDQMLTRTVTLALPEGRVNRADGNDGNFLADGPEVEEVPMPQAESGLANGIGVPAEEARVAELQRYAQRLEQRVVSLEQKVQTLEQQLTQLQQALQQPQTEP